MAVRTRVWATALAAVVATAGASLTAGTAIADEPAPGASSATVAAPVLDRAAAEREFLRGLAMYDYRWTVRSAALSALTSRNPDAAAARFWASDYPFAVRYAAQARYRNADFVRQVLATHREEYSPHVYAAASHAVYGSATEQDWFVRVGYAASKELDRQAREVTREQAAALVQADREWVARLAENDPGAQVRAAATLALRAGGTDDDIVEFFAHDWVAAASLDVQTYRTRCADADAAWRVTARRLLADAQAATQAAREASAEAEVQARDAAARAWATLRDQTGPARVAWADAGRIALEQAANWEQIAAAAGATTSPTWQLIADTAQATSDTWTVERGNAATQAAYWQSLYEQALAGETEMSGPPVAG